jgi:hypothetical protein
MLMFLQKIATNQHKSTQNRAQTYPTQAVNGADGRGKGGVNKSWIS